MGQRIRRLLRIYGRVQGVSYRAFLQAHAMRLGLAGWTRNRSDGSVEAMVEGEAGAIEQLIARLRQGPPGARVDGVEASEPPPEALREYGENFAILPTP